MKKKFNILTTVLIIIGIVFSSVFFVGAASTIAKKVSFTSKNIKTVFNVRNYKYNGTSSTNLGGISVGAANNRLFCVKSGSGEEIGTLYYYNNIYDEGFSDGTKLPKRIVFIDGLLGHANAMAIDDKYVYVTMWQKNGTEKNSIIRISRRAISHLKDGDVVSKKKKTVTVKDTDEKIKIYDVFEPKTESGEAYSKKIASITRYSYNKTAGRTKFIIGYSNGKSTLGFTFATITDSGLTVSTSKDDIFYVKNTAKDGTTATIQDIFYDSAYGLFIAMWNGGVENQVLRANIKGISSEENRTCEPIQVISIKKESDQNGTLDQFEIESMAFVKRDSNKNSSDYRFIFSCNKDPKNSSQRDSIEELVGFSSKVPKLS